MTSRRSNVMRISFDLMFLGRQHSGGLVQWSCTIQKVAMTKVHVWFEGCDAAGQMCSTVLRKFFCVLLYSILNVFFCFGTTAQCLPLRFVLTVFNAVVKLRFIVDAGNHSVISGLIIFISNQVLPVDLLLSMTHVSKSLHALLHVHLPVQILLVLLFFQLFQLFYFSLNLSVALLLSVSLLRIHVTLIHILHLLLVVLVLHLTANLFIVVLPDPHLLILHIVGGGVHPHLSL